MKQKYEQTINKEMPIYSLFSCSPPKECCALYGCCYSVFTPVHPHVSEMFNFLIWTYWYLWLVHLFNYLLN